MAKQLGWNGWWAAEVRKNDSRVFLYEPSLWSWQQRSRGEHIYAHDPNFLKKLRRGLIDRHNTRVGDLLRCKTI